MLSVGSKVIYKHSGVYEVEAVETPTFAAGSGILYYKLSHIFSTAKETVFVPCDSESLLRSVITRDEYQSGIESVKCKEIVPFTARQPQIIAEHYKHMLSDNSFNSLLTVFRELLFRQRECDENGKKLRQAEAHYLSLTERAICEELCICLSTEPNEAKEKLRADIF